MKSKKDPRIFMISKANKRKTLKYALISSAIIITTIVFSLSISFFNASINPTSTITWRQEEGDIYYFGLKDDLYWQDRQDDNAFISQTRAILENEILQVKDLESDWDLDDDLTILSSVLLGSEDLNAFDFPNFLNIYRLITTSYSIDGLINFTNKNDWSLSNPLFVQYSSVYKHLISLMKLYNLEQIGEEMNTTEFSDIYHFIDWITNEMNFLNAFNETFNENTPFQAPHNFTLYNPYPEYNDALVTSDLRLNLSQSSLAHPYGMDILSTSLNLISDWLNKEPIGERVPDLESYSFHPTEFNFNLEINDSLSNILSIQLMTDYFNHSAFINSDLHDFMGNNGYNLRINNGVLQYCIGNYIYDNIPTIPPSPKSPTIPSLPEPSTEYVRESLPSEKGWHDIWDLSSIFYEGSIYGREAKFQIYASPSTPFSFTIDLWSELLGYKIGSTIKSIYIDCPYFLSPENSWDNLRNNYSLFNPLNFTNLVFTLSNTTSGISADLIDDLYIDGNLYYQLDSFEDLSEDFLIIQVVVLAILHTLYFPNEFPFDAVESIFIIMNQINSFLYNITDFFNVTSNEDMLKITINYTNKSLVGEEFLNLIGMDSSLLRDKDMDLTQIITFDKRINILNESYFILNYNDLGITREIGMQLLASKKSLPLEEMYDLLNELRNNLTIAQQDSEANSALINNLLDQINEVEDGLVRIYDEYPAYPSSGWLSTEEFDDTLGGIGKMEYYQFIITQAITCIITVAIVEGIRFFRRKRQNEKIER